MQVLLLTRGSPEQLSGGHLYHQAMAAAAARHGASVRFATASSWHPPPPADVVVIDSLVAAGSVPWTVGRRRRPFVAVVHQRPGGVDGRSWRRWLHRHLDGLVYRRCDAVVAVSPALAGELERRWHVDAARVHVIEPGCDVPVGPSADPVRPRQGVTFLCVANWLPNKGILGLLDAFAPLDRDAARLHLVGRGDVDAAHTADVQRRLAAAELADRVIVHGPVPHERMALLYGGADVLVAPSEIESYGTACSEALALGVPVVGWRRPHLEHLVHDGIDGCLVEPGDVAALTRVLDRLTRDAAWRAQLTDGATRRAETLPKWADAADRFFAVLSGAVASRHQLRRRG